MKKQVSVSCPMDCFDLCRFRVTVEHNRVIHLAGDPHHPLTQGRVCRKGKKLVDRMNHPDRLRHPLIRSPKGFVPASYDQVFDLLSEKLLSIRETDGNTAIMNYASDGYGGAKGRIQSIFFNCFGGDTRFEGSLCWGAGMAAQAYDFGSVQGHVPQDILNSKLVILWGRNPSHTSLHLQSLVAQARKKGARVMVIDPIHTATAKTCDRHIPIAPATDGALALAMARVLIEKELVDREFVKTHVQGFERFKTYVAGFTPEVAQQITGIGARDIEDLAVAYATTDPASIYLGYGLQRYENGGSTVRCIDALAALAGHIGKRGGGVNYAAKSLALFLNAPEKKSRKFAAHTRTFPVAKLGAFLQTAAAPPIKAIFVCGGNPLVQSPDLGTLVPAFSKIAFKVVFDHFMTDTAALAEVVLPAASVFEQEDLFVTSMYSHVLNYSQKAVEPPASIMPEFEFYLELARRLGLDNLGFNSSADYLEQCAAPVLKGADWPWDGHLESLNHQYVHIKAHDIAWADQKFLTPSGKIEIYSEKALADGLSALPQFSPARQGSAGFPLRLLTCHTRDAMHSQGFEDQSEIPQVFINDRTARALGEKFSGQGVSTGQQVRVTGRNGSIQARVCLDGGIYDNTAFMYQGFWHKSGAVNFLTESRVSEMGGQAAYYDSFCTLEPL